MHKAMSQEGGESSQWVCDRGRWDAERRGALCLMRVMWNKARV